MKKIALICLALMAFSFSKADNYVASVAQGKSSWLSIKNNTVNLPAEATDVYVNINTNLVLTASSRPAWATPTFPSVGVLKLTTRANKTANSRKYVMNLKAKDGRTLALNLVQLGTTAACAVNKEKVNFYGDKLVDSFTVTANTDYTLECPEWVNVEKTEDGNYKVTTKKLYGQYNRTGKINVKDAQGNILTSITAEQKYHNSCWFEKPCFVSISDIHVGDTTYSQTHEARMPRVIKTLNSFDPIPQGIVIVGDLADHGKEAEYKKVLSYFNDSTTLNQDIKKYYLRGNHDNLQTNGKTLFTTYMNSATDIYFEMGGYPFIGISDANSLYRGECYSEETYAFLKKSLIDANSNYPGKPIFVFTHVLPLNTIRGSYPVETGDLGAYDDHLDEIFSQFPQVININGHTHYSINRPNQIYQKYYTTMNDGSQKRDGYGTYNELDAEKEIDYDAVTEGLFFHIDDDDNVIIERWNTARGVKYPQNWVIQPPFDGSNFTYTSNRTGGKAPWWPTNAALQISHATDSTCYLHIPQAIDDNEGVNAYKISVTNAAGEAVIATFAQNALNYMGTQRPDTIIIPLKGLPSEVPLTAKVYGYDHYSLTTPTLSVSFVLKKEE